MGWRNHVFSRSNHVAFTNGTALGEIGRQLGASPQTTLAAGDHYNDLPMLSREFAHLLVAPDNAMPAVEQEWRVSRRTSGLDVAGPEEGADI
jgi:hydroxymethylpyrimidine pyrophosphatase-like HAD family hydrolase